MKKKAILALSLALAMTFTSVVPYAPGVGALPTEVQAEEDDEDKPSGKIDPAIEKIVTEEGIDKVIEIASGYFYEELQNQLVFDENGILDVEASGLKMKNDIPDFVYQAQVTSDEQMEKYLANMKSSNPDQYQLYQWMNVISMVYFANPDKVRFDSFKEYVMNKAKEEYDEYYSPIASVMDKIAKQVGEDALMPIPFLSEKLGFTGDGLSDDEVDEVFEAVICQNPQLYFLKYAYLLGTDKDKLNTILIPKVYKAFNSSEGVNSPEQYDGMELATDTEMQKEIDKALDEIQNMITEDENTGDVVTARCVHDWLIAHVDYDMAGGGYVDPDSIADSRYADHKDTYGEIPKGKTKYRAFDDYSFSQSMYSVFGRRVTDDTHYPIFCSDEKTARTMSMRKNKDNDNVEYYTVCAGYSAAYTLLCRLCGLDVFTGGGSGHAWNLIKMNSEWVHVDTTWDDNGGLVDDEKSITPVTYQYFGVCYDKDYKDGHDYTKEGNASLVDLYPYVTSWNDDSMYPAKHYYRVDDAPDYEKSYFAKWNGKKATLYGPVEKIDPSKKAESHATYTVAATDVSEDDLDSMKEWIGVYDTPYYFKHEDVVTTKPSSSSSSSNTYSGGSTTTTAAVYTSGSGGSSSKGSNIKMVGKGNAKGGYSKHTKKKNKLAYFEYPAGKWNIKSFTVPDEVKIKKKTYKVTKITANAFSGYDKLEKVTLGKNVTTIGKTAFDECKKLKTLTINSQKLTAKGVKGSLKGSSVKTIYVPAEKVAAYKTMFSKKNSGSKTTVMIRPIAE